MLSWSGALCRIVWPFPKVSICASMLRIRLTGDLGVDQSLAVAKDDNKPIFLSIGYSSCHWCTVMEGEAFSDAAIADYINAHFLPIKVDREERPDLDSIYMQALQMMTGQGGWPLNVFLDPHDLTPFYGGTYFPLTPNYGRPGFLQVLQAIRRFYDMEDRKLAAVKSEILSGLQQATRLPVFQNLGRPLLRQGLDASARILAPSGYGTSFPMIPYALAALRGIRFETEFAEIDFPINIRQICTQRGLNLALGGIYDQVGGGFHRYTVDPTWTVPHFEKMLYDNGQIVEYLAELWGAGVKEPAFERAIAGTVLWLKREMIAPEGYFYAAQDADSFVTPTDSEPEEGAFYVWGYDELQALLSPSELTEIEAQFTVTATGNFEQRNVLQRRRPGALSDQVETALAKLFQVRYGGRPDQVTQFPPAHNNEEAKSQPWPGRIPCVTDTKMIVAWNSLMISGLAKASAVLARVEYLDLAAAAAAFILAHQWVEGRFHRLNYQGQVAVPAQSEDYALFIKALLDLHQARLVHLDRPNDINWLDQALRVQAEFDEWLWSVESSGYYNTSRDVSDSLLVRERNYQDSAVPAANGVAIANLIRLALLSSDLTHLNRAEQTLQAFGTAMEKVPRACPSLFSALDWYLHPTLVRTTGDRLALLLSQYLPTAVGQLEPVLPGDSVGLVCQGLSCQEPAATEAQFKEQIEASQRRP